MAKNTPCLRFPEFKDEWKFKKLAEVTKINQGLQIPISERLTEKVPNSYFYITNEFIKVNSERKYYILNPSPNVICTKEDILMTRTGNTGIVITNIAGVFHNNFFKVKYSNELVKDFLYLFLNLDKTQKIILKLAGTSTIPDLNHSDFYRIPISFPTLPEQIKIANFLIAVDEKIQALRKKKELTQQYKKGIMQRIFSQELRFTDENGNQFPDWEEKKLGEVADYEQPTSYLVSSAEYDDSFTTPVLTAGKTFILGYTNESNGIYDKKLPVIIFDDFTTATQFVDFPFKAKSSAMKIITAKTGFDIKFIFEVMQTINYEKGGHGRHWISIFTEIQVLFPSFPEQVKISNFIYLIDKHITTLESQILKTEQWKKGLLQKMFC